MLENYDLTQLNNTSNPILQLDGAHIVRDFLNVNFPGPWIGRGGPIACPPRSPDLTPLDIFLRGCVKDQMYSQRVNRVDEHRARNTELGSLQQLQMSQRTCCSASGKSWTIGGMYAELHMALIVKCFASNNLPILYKKLFQL
jgi:hypothetical protein